MANFTYRTRYLPVNGPAANLVLQADPENTDVIPIRDVCTALPGNSSMRPGHVLEQKLARLEGEGTEVEISMLTSEDWYNSPLPRNPHVTMSGDAVVVVMVTVGGIRAPMDYDAALTAEELDKYVKDYTRTVFEQMAYAIADVDRVSERLRSGAPRPTAAQRRARELALQEAAPKMPEWPIPLRSYPRLEVIWLNKHRARLLAGLKEHEGDAKDWQWQEALAEFDVVFEDRAQSPSPSEGD